MRRIHLLETPSANLQRFMQSLETGYTVYYNLRHRRSGHLFFFPVTHTGFKCMYLLSLTR